ncbi:MAG: hypothetical protein ACE37F_35640 [Nannocystaceae bacterium]|nr:hypothetical protein [bacterium]
MRYAALTLAVLTLACDSGVSSSEQAVPVPAPGKADAVDAGLPMITEYVEPVSGNNKAVELYNPLPFAVSMDACAVEVFFNGRTQGRRIPLQGVVMQPRGTMVLCHGGADDIDSCDLHSNNLSFNGNDAVALRCDFGGSEPATLDVVGVVGENPGTSGWEVDGRSTRNETLRRDCAVQSGFDVFEAEQWQAAGAGDYSGLGEHEVCDEVLACNQGEDIIGAALDPILAGDDPRFDVLVEETMFDHFTPRTQALLLSAATRFGFPEDEITDAASAVGAIARDGTGGIERFVIRDEDSGLEYDAVRYYANDATEHSVVHEADGGPEVAFSFDGELFGCAEGFCSDGDLTLPLYEGVDEEGEPAPRFTIVEQHVVLADGARARRVFRRGEQATLLTAAFDAHQASLESAAATSTEALEQLARDNDGPLTYVFLAGPTEDLEGVVFHGPGGVDYGLFAVEDSNDAELVTRDGAVIACAPPPA